MYLKDELASLTSQKVTQLVYVKKKKRNLCLCLCENPKHTVKESSKLRINSKAEFIYFPSLLLLHSGSLYSAGADLNCLSAKAGCLLDESTVPHRHKQPFKSTPAANALLPFNLMCMSLDCGRREPTQNANAIQKGPERNFNLQPSFFKVTDRAKPLCHHRIKDSKSLF